MFINNEAVDIYDLEGLERTAEKYAGAGRFGHIKSTARKAIEIAEIFGMPDEVKKDLTAAALLHDITKNFILCEHEMICAEYGYSLSDEDKMVESVIHAVSGAIISRHEFGANDTIFRCIRNHATGGANDFSLPEKMLYLADYIEDTRKYAACVRVREFFHKSIQSCGRNEQPIILDRAVILSLELTINHLQSDSREIHGDSLLCLKNLYKTQ